MPNDDHVTTAMSSSLNGVYVIEAGIAVLHNAAFSIFIAFECQRILFIPLKFCAPQSSPIPLRAD